MIKKGHRHADGGLAVVLTRIPGLTKKGLLKKTYRFQIAPLNEFGWEASHSWSDYDTIRGGQFTREGGRQQKSIAFETLVLDWSPRWATWAGGDHHGGRNEPDGKGTNPQEVDRDLEKILDAGTPFRLEVWNRALYAKPMIHMPVTLRSLSVRENAGEPDAHYYNLSMVEYRRPDYEERAYGNDGGGGGSGRHELPATIRIDDDGIAHELSAGEDEDKKEHHVVGTQNNPATMRELAKHFYGETSSWTYIARKNGITDQGPNESLAHLVKRGRQFRRLTIPALAVSGPAGGRGGGEDDDA